MSRYQYPPTSLDHLLIEQLSQVYKSIINTKDAIYISTPMTSGLLYMQAFDKLPNELKETGLTEEYKKTLFNQNCQHARSVASMTRLHFPTSCVIDPTNVAIDGWEQNDYLAFWRKVITDYTRIIRFVNDWPYSNGCAYEFLIGVVTNKVMIDEDENTIYHSQGRDLIYQAYREHLERGYNNEFLLNVVASLDRFFDSEDGS